MIHRPGPVKPRLRGLLHLYAFFASLPALAVLLLASQTGRAAVAATVYGLSLVALFGVSALFHRVTWSPRARRWMGRLDHAMINVSIAATFTPFGLLVLSGTLATVSLAAVWGGALGGILLHVLWIDAPKSLSAVVYVVYAFRRPDPAPGVFGYHEVFHGLVIAAAVTHYVVVALYVLPHV